MPEINIRVAGNICPVYIGCPLEKIGSKMKTNTYGRKVLLLSDKNVFRLYGNRVKEALTSTGKEVVDMVLVPGEKTKNFKQLERIIGTCAKNKISRDDTLLTLGGGVISDIGGFAASIYMRGINFVVVPTTLLAQIDAAIGGKTAVNLPVGKNLVGTFYQPSFVYIDIKTLETLSYNEMQQGLAEIIKYGVIKSKKIFDIMEDTSRDIKSNLEFLMSESIKIKKTVVEKDEKEKKGLREILNFGHTLGHAIEISHFPRFSHGQAVAIGMVGESYISLCVGICKQDTFDRIKNAVKGRKLSFSFTDINLEYALQFMRYDKKVRQGNIRFVLPEKIGSVKTGIPLNIEEVQKILKTLPEE